MQFKPGDRVQVYDPGLDAIRKIMLDSGNPAPPNNQGTVADHQDEYDEHHLVIINFDDGVAAPYPAADVRPLAPEDDAR